MRRLLPAFVFLLYLAPGASADQLPESARSQLQLFLETRDRADLVDLTGTDRVSDYLLERVLAERPDRVELRDIRQDLQGGSLSARAAGTSIVSRPGLTDFVSAALESGAVSRKSDDQSVTFSVNALPLRQLLSGELPRGCGSLDNACRRGSGRWLRGLSASVSLNPSSGGSAVPANETGEPEAVIRIAGRTLQVVGVRYELLVRERDSGGLQSALDAAAADLQQNASAFLQTQESFETALGALLDLGWKQETIRLLERSVESGEDLEDLLLDRYRAVYDMVGENAALQGIYAATLPATLAYISAQNAVLAEKLYRKALSVDYLHERPTDQPPLHQVRAVFSMPLGPKSSAVRAGAASSLAAPTGMVTANAGLSVFDPGIPEESGWKVRDAQFSVGVDWSPRLSGRFRPVYTAAYYFQYMVSNGVLEFTGEAVTPGGAAIPLPKTATELLDTKGPIHIAQLRVSFPVGNGVSFPAALSYSNRTELIKGRGFWQGHLGVSYDFSQLRKVVENNE